MSFLRYRDLLIFFVVLRMGWSQAEDDLDGEQQKKEISIPKRRRRPSRYHKKDISIPQKDATPPFFFASFFPFFWPCPPHPSPDPLFLVEKRQPAKSGLWVRFWTGLPHRKKREILDIFQAREKRWEDKSLDFLNQCWERLQGQVALWLHVMWPEGDFSSKMFFLLRERWVPD